MVTKSDANDIIEALLKHQGIDVNEHYKHKESVAQQPQVGQVHVEVEHQQPQVESDPDNNNSETDPDNNNSESEGLARVLHPWNTLDNILYDGQSDIPSAKRNRVDELDQSDKVVSEEDLNADDIDST